MNIHTSSYVHVHIATYIYIYIKAIAIVYDNLLDDVGRVAIWVGLTCLNLRAAWIQLH